MKKRFLTIKNKDRWLGLAIAVSSVYILSEANIATQWIGWLLSVIACVMWVYFGYRDKDYPRAFDGIDVSIIKYESNVQLALSYKNKIRTKKLPKSLIFRLT